MRQEGFFFSAVGGHGCCQKPTVWWESAPAVAINLNSRTNQRRRDDKASASPITTKQIGVIWCCCKSTKCIYCNNCEEVIFKRTHNAASGQQKTCCAILIHSSVTLFIHGERMSSKQCPSLYRLGKRKKKNTLWHVLWQAGMKELASVFTAGAAQITKRRRQQKQCVVCTLR